MGETSEKRQKVEAGDPAAMTLSMPPSSKVSESPTAQLVSAITRLKAVAAEAGIKPADMVLANIGDIDGIPELPVVKEARSLSTKAFNESHNKNFYPPYPGLTPLREAVALDLMRRLGFGGQGKDELTRAGVLLPGQDMSELVSIAAGSVGCSGSIWSHVKYHHMQRGKATSVIVAMDRTHYWKHQGVGQDFGQVQVYDFMACKDGALRLDSMEAHRFGRDGGGVMMLNFGNPLAFLPTAEEGWKFAGQVAEWNHSNPSQEITVCVDGPYDDFYGPQGYRFVGYLLQAGVTTTYIHPRTKEEFATGARGGEVLCNNPAVRQLFNAFKADYIGSDSMLEQEIAIHLHSAPLRDEQKESRHVIIQERKEFFWSLLGKHEELAAIQKDTAPFYRPNGPYYVFLNLTSLIPGKFADSMEICVAMAKMGVIIVPGTLFDLNPAAASGLNKVCVRLSFGSLDSELWKSKIEKLVKALLQLV